MAQDIYLKGTSGDWYEDVTFRVKDKYINNTPKNLAAYADELITNHMKLKGYSEYNPYSTGGSYNNASVATMIDTRVTDKGELR